MADDERPQRAAWAVLGSGIGLIALYAVIRTTGDIGGGVVLLVGYVATGLGVLMLLTGWIERRRR